MALTIPEIIVAIIISAITGAIAALIAPWAKWGVEKRKKKLELRKKLLDECKRRINKSEFNPDMFRETALYSSLKPYLTKKLQEEVEEKRYEPGTSLSREKRIKISEKEFAVKKKLLDEISILERKWGLL